MSSNGAQLQGTLWPATYNLFICWVVDYVSIHYVALGRRETLFNTRFHPHLSYEELDPVILTCFNQRTK